MINLRALLCWEVRIFHLWVFLVKRIKKKNDTTKLYALRDPRGCMRQLESTALFSTQTKHLILPSNA